MFKDILVPLDGSAFAEQALDFAAGLAVREGALLHLIHVDTGARATAAVYLEQLAAQISERHAVRVEAAVVQLNGGSVARTLAGEVEARAVRSVVMTTHGRSGLERLWLGSVADQLVRMLHVPLFLLRSRAPMPPRRILVALDGTPLAERALAPALHLAHIMRAQLTLLRVVALERAWVVTPHGARWVELALPRERAVEEAQHYLEGLAQSMPPDLLIDTQVLVHESIPTALSEAAEQDDAALIALTTRARHGLERWLLGSVADKLLRSTTRPLLIVHPE
ncbi:MAG: universal stress protein [Thermoflexales bacterium]